MAPPEEAPAPRVELSEPEPEPDPQPEPQPEPQPDLELVSDLDMLLTKAAELLATATTQADPSDAKAHYQGSLAMFEAALAYATSPCPLDYATVSGHWIQR
jgi:hypothetical protein